MNPQSEEEINFSAIAVDASPAHIKFHLKKCNDNVRNALNEHFEGRCGPFIREAVASNQPPTLPAGNRAPDPQRRDRLNEGMNEEAVDDSRAKGTRVAQKKTTVRVVVAAAAGRGRGRGGAKKIQQQEPSSSEETSSSEEEEESSSEDSSSNEDAAAVSAARSTRGGRGRGAAARGRGRGAAAIPAAKAARGRQPKKGQLAEDEAEKSSSEDSSDDEDSDDDEDASSSSSEETDQGDDDDRPRGRGRGRGRAGATAAVTTRGGRAARAVAQDAAPPKAAAPKKETRGKKKKKNASDDENEDEEGSGDDGEGRINNINFEGEAAFFRRPKAPQGKPCKETRDFIELCVIPFPTRIEARNKADAESLQARRANEPFFKKAQDASHNCVVWQQNYGHPLHILSPQTATPVTAPFANLLGFLPAVRCSCLFPASECSSMQTRRRLLSVAYSKRQCCLYINPESACARRCFALREGSVEHFSLQSVTTGAVREQFNKMITVSRLPDGFKKSIEYHTNWDANFVYVPPASVRLPASRGEAKKLLPPTHVANRRFEIDNYGDNWSGKTGWETSQFLVLPTVAMTQPFVDDHLYHQLHLRIRACLVGAERTEPGQHDDLTSFASMSYRTVATTRDGIWSRRFCAHNIAQIHFPKQIVAKTTFSNMLTSFMTPKDMAKEIETIQSRSAKEIFAEYDANFTRADIDIRHIPVRPPGVTVDLYPHQRRAIAFMLDRERNGFKDQLTATPPIPIPKDRHNPAGYTHYRFHISTALGAVVAAAVGSPEEAEILAGGKSRGGIIACQVGMGKTLSVLSTVILNPPADPSPKIIKAENPIRSGIRPAPARGAQTEDERLFRESLTKKLQIKATLIIVPLTLVGQWEMEMGKRCPELSIIRYHGTGRKKYTYDEFAAADIVITTFETYRITLNQEFFWFKWYETNATGVGAHLAYNDWASINLPANAASYPNLRSFFWDAKSIKKSIIDKTGGPDKNMVFLSRLHFHRIIMDEFHKSGGLRSDMPIVDSNFLWLVSGTPLDADISPVLKRMGVLDYSFVSNEAVRFTANATDDSVPHPLSGDIVGSHLQLEFNYDVARALSPVVPINFTGSYTAPPTCAANFARFALLTRLMIRNNIDTCPELANVRVTEKVIKLRHTAEEKVKYQESVAAVQAQIQALRVRGRIQTHIMEIIRLLNELRKAAVDPFGVTIAAQDALAIRGGAGFENENTRRNIVLVPIAAFSHLAFPQIFKAPATPAVAELKKTFAHVPKITTHDDLKDSLIDLNKTPPGLPSCVICLDDVQQPTVLICGHMMCRECVLALVQRAVDSNCPICRKANAINDNSKKSLLTFPIPEIKEEVDPDSPLQANSPALPPPRGKLPTKIKAACQIVQEEIAKDATSKFLIFTSFPSVIACLRQELARMAIGSVIIDASSTLTQRAKRIALFQDRNNYNCRVCIISSRVGNAGLTATAANHLLIIEPSSNIDVDTQILGRVKRLGQLRAVTCHRLHVEDTIEMPLYDLVRNRTVSLSAGGSEAARKAASDTILSLVYPNGVPEVLQGGMMMMGYDSDDDDDDEYDSDMEFDGDWGGNIVI